MMISNFYNNSINRIDNGNKYGYNYPCRANATFQSYRKAVMTNMDIKENIIKKMGSLGNLEKSPVAYIKPLMEKYLNNQVTTIEFINTFNKETGFAKYSLSKLSNNDINEIKKIFKNELNYADNLNLLILSLKNKDIPRQDFLTKIAEL